MIGILSGAGPMAGFDVARKIIEETKAVLDQEHLPVLVFSLPEQLPDRTAFLLGKSEDNPGVSMGNLFLDLERAGATIAAIACNTAHAPRIFDEVHAALERAGSKLRVLNLVEETAQVIQESVAPQTKVGILSTDGTRQTGLYKNALLARGLQVVEPNAEAQELVQRAIYDPVFGIKAKSAQVDDRARACLEQVINELIAEGAELILLGCTELPLALNYTRFQEVNIVDPNRILARRMIELYAPAKLR